MCGHDPTEGRNWARICWVIGALFMIAALVFAVRLSLGALVFFFWGIVYGVAGVLFHALPGRLARSRIWNAIEAEADSIAVWAPLVGILIALGYGGAAIVFVRDRFLFLINLFWACAFIVVGLMIRGFGFRRTAALCALFAGGLYTVATVFWIEQSQVMLIWANLPWAGLCFLGGAFVDRKRISQSEPKPISGGRESED